MYVVYVWTGRWLISLVLVTSDNKGLLLLQLADLSINQLMTFHLACHAIRVGESISSFINQHFFFFFISLKSRESK